MRELFNQAWKEKSFKPYGPGYGYKNKASGGKPFYKNGNYHNPNHKFYDKEKTEKYNEYLE